MEGLSKANNNGLVHQLMSPRIEHPLQKVDAKVKINVSKPDSQLTQNFNKHKDSTRVEHILYHESLIRKSYSTSMLASVQLLIRIALRAVKRISYVRSVWLTDKNVQIAG